jgi:predicted lysophospholipase L1 biosynthesis ABC-type transport system permease subunit
VVAAAIVVPAVFEIDYSLRFGPILAIWVVVVSLTVVTGLMGSRDLLRRPPLPVLRDAPE